MKEFEKVLKLTQRELKIFLNGYLTGRGYDVISEDGFLYAKGTLPVLLVAHMDRYPDGDTLHPERYINRGPIEIYETFDGITMKSLQKRTSVKKDGLSISDFMLEHYKQNLNGSDLDDIIAGIRSKIKEGNVVWISPQGICGDDRCGVWIIMKIIKNLCPSILLTEDEEVCGEKNHGVIKFCNTSYINELGVNYMIQIDRCKSKEAKFYCCQNTDFQKLIIEKTAFTFIPNDGRKTDITRLMPKCNIAGVNLSCGYYNEHFPYEYVAIGEMQRTVETVTKLLGEMDDRVFTAQCC